jgi:hypothetical protein
MSQGTTLVVPLRLAKWVGLQPLKDVCLKTSRQIYLFRGLFSPYNKDSKSAGL